MWGLLTAILVICYCTAHGWNDISVTQEEIKAGKHFQTLLKSIFDPRVISDLQPWMRENENITWIDETNPLFVDYMSIQTKGLTPKGIPFDVYNSDMLIEAKYFINLLSNLELDQFHLTAAWARNKVNEGLFLYSIRASLLYSILGNNVTMPPPSNLNPYNFFDGKSLRTINKFYMKFVGAKPIKDLTPTGGVLNINVGARYSGWNINDNACDKVINYFREDPALNSYYLGIHLLHPFWMTNAELNSYNPKHSELYFHHNHQLMARYKMERLSLNLGGIEDFTEDCLFSDYIPYLEYPDGNLFPMRKNVNQTEDRSHWQEMYATSQSVYQIISEKEYISNGEAVSISQPEDLPKLVELVRKYLDNFQSGRNIRRALYDTTSSAPSVMNNPETSLRDPLYWKLMNRALNIFYKFKSQFQPRDLAILNDSSIKIKSIEVKISPTYFIEFNEDVSNAILTNERIDISKTVTISQRRLCHDNFTVEINVESSGITESVVRIFLGPKPKCVNKECERDWKSMVEVDVLKTTLMNGENHIQWSDNNSTHFMNDDLNNLLLTKGKLSVPYDIYRFPRRLIVPKGHKEGLELELVVLITRQDGAMLETVDNLETIYYQETRKIDGKPAGFPFDLPFVVTSAIDNLRFVPVYVYHTEHKNDPNIL